MKCKRCQKREGTVHTLERVTGLFPNEYSRVVFCYPCADKILREIKADNVSDRYLTSFCNHAHRLSDGKPVGHECYVLPTEMLVAERAGNIARAHEVMGGWKKRKLHKGLKEGAK